MENGEGMKRQPLKGGTRVRTSLLRDSTLEAKTGSFEIAARVAKVPMNKRHAVHLLTVAVHFDPLHRARLSKIVAKAVRELIEDAGR